MGPTRPHALAGLLLAALAGAPRLVAAQAGSRASALPPSNSPTAMVTITPAATGLGDDLSYALEAAWQPVKRLARDLPVLLQADLYEPQTLDRIHGLADEAGRDVRKLRVVSFGARLLAGSRRPVWAPDIAWSDQRLGVDIGASWSIGSTDSGFRLGGRLTIVDGANDYRAELDALESNLRAMSDAAQASKAALSDRSLLRRLRQVIEEVAHSGQRALEAYDATVTAVRVSVAGSHSWYSLERELGAVGIAAAQLVPLGAGRPCPALLWQIAAQGVRMRSAGARTTDALRVGVVLAWQDQTPHARLAPTHRNGRKPASPGSYRWTTRAGAEYVGSNRVDGEHVLAFFLRRRDPNTGLEWTLSAGKDAADRAFLSARLGWSMAH
ncbi:MAG TPA: hypothetical protein VLH79_11985 [Chthonomonadales bacterium]|nr:hypothetical protein [Chthonomonadales bacterium]